MTNGKVELYTAMYMDVNSWCGNMSIKDRSRRYNIPIMEMLRATFSRDGKAEYALADSWSGYYPEFPILIHSNGEPWRLGNLYLTSKLKNTTNYEIKTFEGIADSLLHYLRFLESEGFDPLSFPKIEFRRPTYCYRHHLLEEVYENNLNPKTASLRINSVVAFVSSQKVLANDSSIILEDMHSNDDVRWFFIFTSTF